MWRDEIEDRKGGAMSRWIAPVVAVVLAALAAGGQFTAGGLGLSAAQEGSPAAASCPTTTAEENKTLARRYLEEALGQGNLAVLDEVLAEDHVVHTPGTTSFLPVAQIDPAGRDRLEASIQESHTDFPDLRLAIEDMVAEGDRVASRLTLVGTQADPLDSWSAPNTGRRTAREVWVFHRVVCGRIAESWVLPDNLTLLRQLGIITDDELRTAGTPTVATPVP
jgi:predicted ester cyclase